jgi:hypothetical protein
MPLNRPAESVMIKLTGRITVANANMTAVVPEAIQNLIQLVNLNGSHRKYGNLTPIRMTGATLFSWLSLFQVSGNDLIINGVRANAPGRPFASAFLGNVGTYDFILTLNIPLGPLVGIGQSAKRDLAAFLWQAQDWGDSLTMQIGFGDASSLGTPTTAGDVTLTAFGSASGSPTFSTFVNYSILGDFAGQFDTGVIVRQEQLFTSFVAAATRQRISQLQKQITPNVLLKTGTSLAGVTSGVHALGCADRSDADHGGQQAPEVQSRQFHVQELRRSYVRERGTRGVSADPVHRGAKPALGVSRGWPRGRVAV